MVFALKLAWVQFDSVFSKYSEHLKSDFYNIEVNYFELLLKEIDFATVNDQISTSQYKFTDKQVRQLSALSKHASLFEFKDLEKSLQNTQKWQQFIESTQPENVIQDLQAFNLDYSLIEDKFHPQDKTLVTQILSTILIRVVRPDKLNIFFESVVSNLLGDHFLDVPQIDLNKLVNVDTDPKTAILMCSAPGFDPSFKVEQLAKETNARLISVAIGSAEGFDQAEKSIELATKSGQWVLLKNVHLAPTWLNEIEKKIYSKDKDKINPKFKLFLAMEFNPKVPSTLIRMSYKLVFEPPNGMKASLQRTYGTVLTEKRTEKLPRERPHLHFLLAWTHAVIIERLRYIPIGWTKSYEFNEADQRCAIDLIDECIDQVAGSSANIDPNLIPWQAIKVILTQNIYGAKIDNEYDSKILVSLIEQYFSPRSFEENCRLFDSPSAVKMPIGKYKLKEY